MPNSNTTSSHKMENNASQDETNTHEESWSDQENDQEVILNQSNVQQVVPSMFMQWVINNSCNIV